MAALQQPAHLAQTPVRDTAPPTPALPNGACTFADPILGRCGCNRFWDELNANSVDHRTKSQRSVYCVCTHHAVYHLDNVQIAPDTIATLARPLAHSSYDGRCQLQAPSQFGIHTAPKDAGQGPVPQSGLLGPDANSRLPQLGLTNENTQQQVPSLNTGAEADPVGEIPYTPLPSIPSVCLLSEDRPHKERAPATGTTVGPVSADAPASNPPLTGLGLSFFGSSGRRRSVSSQFVEELNRFKSGGVDLPSTRANSIRDGSVRMTPPPRVGRLGQVLEPNHPLRLNVESDTVPNTVNPEDFVQSATEVATQSDANTPDLRAFDQAINGTRPLVNALMIKLASPSDRRTGQSPRPAAASTPGQPTPSQDVLKQAIAGASPQDLQEVLLPYVKALYRDLNQAAQISNAIKELVDRVDRVEGYSINQAATDEAFQQIENMEGRVLEIENRVDDLEALRSVEADKSSHSGSRYSLGDVGDSFGSNQSVHSASSALIVSVPSRETHALLEAIKDRVDALEAAAMPTMANPWEVEVILLPWGRDLRGIWFAPDQPMHDTGNFATQDSEDWTQGLYTAHKTRSSQARSSRSPSGPASNGKVSLTSSLNMSDAESGWSSQAISNWAASEVDEWLFPKACKSTNVVYKRLQSRGFVKHVTLTSANARDIQMSLSSAFAHIFEHLRFTKGDEDTVIHAYPSLRAPFIPLRKVRKDSKLRFLDRSEMSSSALWSAQFLSSGVMMRAPGGKKRLYVTQRESYLQHDDEQDDLVRDEAMPQKSWTWQDIRELPRYQDPDSDSQMEGNDEPCQREVPEADAKEACWAYFENLDPPPGSVTSSFNSHHSAPVALSMRPAGRNWRRSMTPSSILKNRQPPQPISPQSELPPLRARHRRLSSSVIDQVPLSSGKRRLNSSPVKQSSYPSARPSSIVGSRPKRRRVASSPYPEAEPRATEPEGPQMHQALVPFRTNNDNNAFVQRRALEPPSPYPSSQPNHPELTRTSSDFTRGSQRSSALATRRATPSAYAYATPYSGPVSGPSGFYGYGHSDGPGDTEPDDGDYQEHMDAESDAQTGAEGEAESDGEQSWRGVDDEEDAAQVTVHHDSDMSSQSNGSSSSNSSAASSASADGDDSGFGSENEHVNDDDDDAIVDEPSQDDDGEEAFDFGSQQPSTSFHGDENEDSDEDNVYVYDHLLGVLGH